MRAQNPSATAALRMQHRAVPFEHPHARLQQRPIPCARQRRQRRNVARPRNQQPDVDTVARRRSERLDVRRGADEVRVGQPQMPARERRDREIEPVGSRCARCTRDHAQPRVALRARSRPLDVMRFVAQRAAAAREPDLRERLLDLGHRGPADLDAGVAPRLHALAADRRSSASLTQSPDDERDAAVDRDRLAVIAREPAERAVEAQRIEAANLRAGGDRGLPQRSRAERAEPVVDDVDVDARARALGQRLGEFAADGIVSRRLAFEEDRSLRAADRVEPRGKFSAASRSSRTALPSIGSEPDARANARSASTRASSGFGEGSFRRASYSSAQPHSIVPAVNSALSSNRARYWLRKFWQTVPTSA